MIYLTYLMLNMSLNCPSQKLVVHEVKCEEVIYIYRTYADLTELNFLLFLVARE